MQAKLLDINLEGDLLRKIMDILDELFIMTHIKTQQETVARTFAKNLQRLLMQDSHGTSKVEQSHDVLFSESDQSRMDKSVLEWKKVFPEMADSGYTMSSARNLLDGVQDQLLELKHLKDTAESTLKALRDLLDLKQQYVSSIQILINKTKKLPLGRPVLWKRERPCCGVKKASDKAGQL
jgi:phage terminase large subunit-like protein